MEFPVTSLLISLLSLSFGIWFVIIFVYAILRFFKFNGRKWILFGVGSWIMCLLYVGGVALMGTYGPRITVSSPSYTPEYTKKPVINLNPHTKSDKQRLEETRQEFDRNKLKGDVDVK